MAEHFKSSNWKLNWNFYDRHQAESEDLGSIGHGLDKPTQCQPAGLTWRMRIVCAHLTDNG